MSPSKNPPAPAKKSGRGARRSKRLGLTVAVKVRGRNVFGESFREFTSMLSVNADGGLLVLSARIRQGQILAIENRHTQEEQEFRVVHVRRWHDGKWKVGIEFVHKAPHFWRVYFPPLRDRRV